MPVIKAKLNLYVDSPELLLLSCSVMSNSVQSHGLQHARLPCPSLLLEFAQTHVHWVSDTIQPSEHLSPPSPSALNLSQHQGLFQWVSSSIRWPKYWSFSFNIGPSNEHSGLISCRMDCWPHCSPWDSPESSNSTTVWKYQFFGTHPSLWSNSHICKRLMEKP